MKIKETIEVEFTRHTCWSCDVQYFMPATLEAQRRKDKRGFFCPNGHEAVFRESEADKLRLERDRLVQEQARLVEDRDLAWRAAEKEATARRAAEAETKRVKKRATAAVCPCCNRTFSQLARHMATKHPEIAHLPTHKIAKG